MIFARRTDHLRLEPPLEGGSLRHMTVWETKEQWERFQAERVGPAVGRVLAGIGIAGAPPPPAVTELDLVDVVTKP